MGKLRDEICSYSSSDGGLRAGLGATVESVLEEASLILFQSNSRLSSCLVFIGGKSGTG